jgi:hypothetical protein
MRLYREPIFHALSRAGSSVDIIWLGPGSARGPCVRSDRDC